MTRLIVWTLVVGAFLAGLGIWNFFFTEKAVEGIIETSGQVRGTEITVSSELAGRIEKLLINEGQKIKAGDLIAKISSEEIEARLQQAKANAKVIEDHLEVNFHRIHQARAGLQRAEATLSEAKSELELAQVDYKRYAKSLESNAIAQREFDRVKTHFEAAQARLAAAKNAKEEATAALQQAQAIDTMTKSLQESAEARTKEIEAVLKDTRIYSPSDGTVIDKLVEQGELVAAGSPVAILIDLSEIYVKVYIPQIQIGRIRLNNEARIFADAFPDRFFTGTITEISQQAEFTPKEVHMKEERTKLVFGVKVKIDKPEGYLKPGMPVDVKIRWKNDVFW